MCPRASWRKYKVILKEFEVMQEYYFYSLIAENIVLLTWMLFEMATTVAAYDMTVFSTIITFLCKIAVPVVIFN